MIKDLLGLLERTDTKPALLILASISLLCLHPDTRTLLDDPISPQGVAIPLAVAIALMTLEAWFRCIDDLNRRLARNDVANYGPMIGYPILVFCLIAAAASVKADPGVISLALLGNPFFYYLAALTLFSVENIRVQR